MCRGGDGGVHARRGVEVFRNLGFAEKIPYGRGLSALFEGPPGTGKTLVASILANDLGLQLQRVDLSRVVSKWVGETEQNLARVFDVAERNGGLLLFDEADALFASRTDVKTANDRYGNMEIDYLLQRMERFEGVTILTSNNGSAIDQAFRRRLRFRLQFPVPGAAERAQLWQRMFPSKAPLATGIDWARLAAEFELSGGYIRNAVLRAAFRAVERGDAITYDDLRRAAALECQEIGMLVKIK